MTRQSQAATGQPGTNCSLIKSPVSDSEAAALINTRPLPPAVKSRKVQRNGHVARLPKLQRDMVNRMLWNAVPYKNIVAALGEVGFTLSERNISNWATGGYLEWRLEQEHLIQCRLDQDHLLDFVRRDDAQELPEAGLQAAATRLSQLMLQKLSRADDPEMNLESYSKMVDLLCRLNRELASSQKQRDDSRRTLGPEYDPVLVKDTETVEVIKNERYHSFPPDDDDSLEKPAERPFLPPIPTATDLAELATQQRQEAELDRMKQQTALLKSFLGAQRNNPTSEKSHAPKPPADS
ncbi:MAG TPA: hypothetical protein VLT36_23895 [Candidatus Dormibacteraeota bacterium]|nr:hypothetical protein [Candidatus Dormibacteraeota bacterium]